MRKTARNAPATALDDASRLTLEWWEEHAMLEDLDQQPLLADHGRILTVAEDLGITTVCELHQRAAGVIAAATGISRIKQFATAADSEKLHRARNALSAVIFCSEVHHGNDPRPYDLILTLPAIAHRQGAKRRPIADDEALLTRSEAIYSLSRGGRYVRIAMQYALAESGARPMETTEITPRDFDDPFKPSTVNLPGVNAMTRPRQVTLGAWAARVLQRGLDRHLALNSDPAHLPLCYAGTSGRHSASASSSNNLKHCMERVGITTPSLQASAITRWRVQRELHLHGEVAALKMLGQFNPLDIKIHRIYEYIGQAPPTVTIPPRPAAKRSFKGL